MIAEDPEVALVTTEFPVPAPLLTLIPLVNSMILCFLKEPASKVS